MPECYRCGKKIDVVVYCPFCGAKQRSGLEMYKAKEKKSNKEKQKAIAQVTGLADKETGKILLDGPDLTKHASEPAKEREVPTEAIAVATEGKPADPTPIPAQVQEPKNGNLVIGKQAVLWIIFLGIFIVFCYVIYIIIKDLDSWFLF